jgi:hypothetical protein
VEQRVLVDGRLAVARAGETIRRLEHQASPAPGHTPGAAGQSGLGSPDPRRSPGTTSSGALDASAHAEVSLAATPDHRTLTRRLHAAEAELAATRAELRGALAGARLARAEADAPRTHRCRECRDLKECTAFTECSECNVRRAACVKQS